MKPYASEGCVAVRVLGCCQVTAIQRITKEGKCTRSVCNLVFMSFQIRAAWNQKGILRWSCRSVFLYYPRITHLVLERLQTLFPPERCQTLFPDTSLFAKVLCPFMFNLKISGYGFWRFSNCNGLTKSCFLVISGIFKFLYQKVTCSNMHEKWSRKNEAIRFLILKSSALLVCRLLFKPVRTQSSTNEFSHNFFRKRFAFDTLLYVMGTVHIHVSL